MANKETIIEALKQVKYPGFSRDIISFGIIREIKVEESTGNVGILAEITTASEGVPVQLKRDIEAVIEKLEGVGELDVIMEVSRPKNAPGGANNQAGNGASGDNLSKVKYVIAVASGKGGVGKSTVSVNLACALERTLADQGRPGKVGLMDCDIYGPSMPLMLGVQGQPQIEGDSLIPLENFGVKVMSMGLLVDEDAPVVWRGPMIMKTIQQFAQNVNWGELDVLVVDLPPGTGDAQLSLVQTIPLDGALIVTTPQAAAVNVARRGARMFDKVNVPLLGVVENMSYLENPKTGERQELFGSGGGSETAQFLETSLLGQIPLEMSIRQGCDNGIPIVISDEDCLASGVFKGVAESILKTLQQQVKVTLGG